MIPEADSVCSSAHSWPPTLSRHTMKAPETDRRASYGNELTAEQVNPLLAARRVSSQIMAGDRGLVQSIRQYPPAVFFMLGNEFCERFSFYGMKALLVLYMVSEHHFSESKATLMYHFFTCIAYLSPLVGSVLADSYFGRFKVILYVSVVYVMGHALLSFGAVPNLPYEIRSFFDFGGLFVIAIATGGIKPCVSAFAADQFGEHQEDLRSQFFSFFYFAINAGSLLAFLLTPILRHRVKCFGSEYCFPLAFGVPGVLMLFALVLFLLGWKFYKKYPPSKENVAGMVVKCAATAASRKLCGGASSQEKSKDRPIAHWLDHAAPTYTRTEIASVKSFVNVAIIFGPLVLFWALFDQMGSTWVLQARRLNGHVGYMTILPEQVAMFNPMIILIAVPVFEGFVYPCARKLFKVTPLRKMAVGGLLTALSFIIAGLLQIEVNQSMEIPPADGRVYIQRVGNASSVGNFRTIDEKLINNGNIPLGRTEIDAGMYSLEAGNKKFELDLSQIGSGYVVGLFDGHENKPFHSMFRYSTEKTVNGATRLYMIVPNDTLVGGKVFVVDYKGNVLDSEPLSSGSFLDIKPPFISQPDYTITWGVNCEGMSCPHKLPFYAQMGAVHVIHICTTPQPSDIQKLVRGNEVNILWMIPQCIVITLGEVLLSVTGLEFAYSQSAPNMKSVLQALWLLTVFMGNVVDMSISGTHIITEPALEFFFYALLMVVVMIIFIFLSMRYTYVEDLPENAEKKIPEITLSETKTKEDSEDEKC